MNPPAGRKATPASMSLSFAYEDKFLGQIRGYRLASSESRPIHAPGQVTSGRTGGKFSDGYEVIEYPTSNAAITASSSLAKVVDAGR